MVNKVKLLSSLDDFFDDRFGNGNGDSYGSGDIYGFGFGGGLGIGDSCACGIGSVFLSESCVCGFGITRLPSVRVSNNESAFCDSHCHIWRHGLVNAMQDSM